MQAIRDALIFYQKCVAWAAAGTFDRANAWFWPIGVPIVAFFGWYLGLGTLVMPESLDQFLTFMVVTVAVSWVVFFLVRLLGAPPHFARGDADVIADLKQRITPRLSVEFQSRPPFVFEQLKFRCYRFRVTNETNALVGSCKALMESAFKSDGTRIVEIPFSLRRSFTHDEIFTLRGGEEIFVDLLAVPLDSQFANYPAKLAELGVQVWPQFGTGGTCFGNEPTRFTVQVLSDAAPVRLALEYRKINGEWRVVGA
jgi:hypothetical protein